MPDRESVFEDIGRHDKPGPYSEVEHLKCPVCGAPPKKRCCNPVTGAPRKIPCIGRKERTDA